MKKSISKIMALALLSVGLFTASCSSDDDKGGNPDNGDFVVVRENLKGEINNGNVVLESGTYKLTGKLLVNNGAKLTIKPGVRIEATDVSTLSPEIRYIAVAQGGQIFVEGTASNPVIMTADTNLPGSWGGVVLCGKAPINKAEFASAEVSDLQYGGNDVNDSSGSIKYLRIEYSGYAYNADKEFNGLSMFGVGQGTTIEYVQIHEGSDDGFEWFGGSVDARYLVVTNFNPENVADDLFDWTEGWNGTGENWFGIRTNASNRGIEADNNSSTHTLQPISNPTIKNLTLVGNGIDGGGENQALKLRVGTQGQFDNVVLKNWGTGFDIEHDATISYVGNELKAMRVKFENVEVKSKGKNSAGETVTVSGVYTEDDSATGAGNGTAKPTWANGWTVGL